MEGASPVHSLHPPVGPRSHYGLHPVVAGEPASHSQMVSFIKYFICYISTHNKKRAHVPMTSVLSLDH